MTNSKRWQFSIDVGGTFTDCVAIDPEGKTHRGKSLSSGATKGSVESAPQPNTIQDSRRAGEVDNFWQGVAICLISDNGDELHRSTVVESNGRTGALRLADELPLVVGAKYELQPEEEAPIQIIRRLIGRTAKESLPAVDIRLGTTRGTNALLTRTGAKTFYVTTRGLGDVLEIGNQDRPHLFDLDIHRPPVLYEASVEVDERIDANGNVLTSPSLEEVRQMLQAKKQAGFQSVAICFMHADRFPQHEVLVESVANELGFDEVSVSHRVSPLIKIISRGGTTTLDAYLNPLLRAYLFRMASRLGEGSTLRLMTSAGGLSTLELFSGKDSLLSGPAGGVIGFSKTAQTAGFETAIGFDMGGTSTDVARYDQDLGGNGFQFQYESIKAGIRVSTPQLAIETVAAGGGSICRFDGTRLVVGPESASSHPGPACYGRGGPLSVTDLNVYLGYVLPEHFPWQLDHAAVEERLDAIIKEMKVATGQEFSRVELAQGFRRVANLAMANAIRSISVAQGYDPRGDVLVAFGGAAPQHACSVAEELGIRSVLIHPYAAILSAYGMSMADTVMHRTLGVYQPLSEVGGEEFEAEFAKLKSDAADALMSEGITENAIRFIPRVELRYRGTDQGLVIPYGSDESLLTIFEEEHQRRFGYLQKNELEIVSLKLEAIGSSSDSLEATGCQRQRIVNSVEKTEAVFRGAKEPIGLFQRKQLVPGDCVSGPALIVDVDSTTVLNQGWSLTIREDDQMLLEQEPESSLTIDRSREEDASDLVAAGSSTDAREAGTSKNEQAEPDPVLLEVFNSYFQQIAAEMGETLRQTAVSVNVKERLDYSCALFTPAGNLVVNAPHIPVHLGAMSHTVKAVMSQFPDLTAGDTVITNDPFAGGSHLPDVTLVSPVFDVNDDLIFWVASRAHHAELGGIRPGSMPPNSKNLAEEGVLISNFLLIRHGIDHFDELESLLRSAPYPSRNVRENIADIQAQLAANRKGELALKALMQRYGLTTVMAYMTWIQDAAETKVRNVIRQLGNGTRSFADHLDDETRIEVKVSIEDDSMKIDFTGTSGVHPGNLNANRSIVTAAVLYSIRCLVAEEIPLNEGLLSPIKLIIPKGLLDPPPGDTPQECPAVVGGNVETSQRVVDVLLGAFGLAAASQGTMNNFLFGNSEFGYYETICGGSGATPSSCGTDGVHTHMTNTRLTDPEILEVRYPVQLRQFKIRSDSGGRGKNRGGCGVVREIEFLADLDVSLLTQRRGKFAPFGANGGEPGAVGRNSLIRNEEELELPGIGGFRVEAGDRVRIETPGGGGWGTPTK